MSLLPILFGDSPFLPSYSDPFRQMERLFGQDFGMGLTDDDLFRVGRRPYHVQRTGVSKVTNNKDGLAVKLDVSHFKPEELTVKVVDEEYLQVEGKHEEREDPHGYVSRHFVRRYKIPSDVDREALKSSMGSDGVLSICAPKCVKDSRDDSVRSIPIAHC